MGEVYSAYDPELDRRVAIKRVRDAKGSISDVRLRDALMMEARSTARINHRNVVKTYDCGLDDGELYVVMELVEGPTLGQWLEARPRSWREIVEIFVQAAEGLACAHEHGIIHRDFKPANVLIDDRGQARVADFGLARIVDDLRRSQSDADASTIVSVEVAGTPQYMAPEQYGGAELSPKTDQFAYCNALYRALFHRAPFEGRTTAELSENVTSGRVQPPRHRHHVPRPLVRAVLRGLALAPDDRHRSMDDLVLRLRSALSRRRKVLWAALGGTLALTAALVGRHWPNEPPCSSLAEPWPPRWGAQMRESLTRRPSLQPLAIDSIMEALDRHGRDWAAARHDACAATRIRQAQSDLLMDQRFDCLQSQRVSFLAISEQLVMEDGPGALDLLTQLEELPPASDCSAELVRERMTKSQRGELPGASAARAESRDQQNALEQRLGTARAARAAFRYEQASQHAREVARQAESLKLRDLLADALLLQGSSALEIARTDEELAEAWRALDRGLLVAIESGNTRLIAEINLAQACGPAPRFSATDRRSRLDVAQAHAKTLPAARTILTRIALARGRLALHEHRASDAIEHFEETIRLAQEGPFVVLARLDIAKSHHQRGELDEAKRIWEEQGSELERLSPIDPRLAAIKHNLAIIAMTQRDFEQALSLNRSAESIYHRHPATDPRYLHSVQIGIARAYRRQGRLPEAQQVLEEVLGALEATGAAGHEVLMRALDEVVEIEIDRGHHERAREQAERWVDVARSRYPEDDREVARARMMLAKAALATGELNLALVQIAAAYENRHGMSTLLQAEAAFHYAEINHALGDRRGAREFYAQTIDTLEHLPEARSRLAMVRGWGQQRGLDSG